MLQVLLQESLRPILVQLGYHNKLQLPLLKGLARLLQLLSSWFNITLGTCPGLFADALSQHCEPSCRELGGLLAFVSSACRNEGNLRGCSASQTGSWSHQAEQSGTRPAQAAKHAPEETLWHGCAGEKLIDHLKKWLEPEKLTSAGHAWTAGQEAQVAAATLHLFHLLPPQAAKFLESGVCFSAFCHFTCFWSLRSMRSPGKQSES